MVRAWLVAGSAAVLVGCGGGNDRSRTPTSPSPPPAPPRPVAALIVSVANPASSRLVSITSTAATLELTGQVTFRETAGAQATVTEFRGTVVRTPGTPSSGSIAESFTVSAFGTVTRTYTQTFTIDGTTQRIEWRVNVSYTDAVAGVRTADSNTVPIQLPMASSPPPVGGGISGRILVFGGRNYDVFLGCLSCNEFDSDSIFNAFGRYGSRFSSTSIWNRFSDYGSRFSSFSACNTFASQPPLIVDERGSILAEMTVNRGRPRALGVVVNWLTANVCE